MPAPVPRGADLEGLREAAAGCRACPLWEDAEQTVFGAGRAGARLMLVGEQPGDREDREGEPFVGPAGRLLDEALDAAGIERRDAYVTNVVKHFKWKPRGKRRIHQTPGKLEIEACRPWLEAELAAVEPDVLAVLGATAAKALLGSSFRVTRQHGELIESAFSPRTLASFHPSAILRAPDEAARSEGFETLVADLRVAAGALG